jgi:hypothetical protein
MANATLYQSPKICVDFSHVRTFSAADGRLISLEEEAEQKRQEAMRLRRSSVENTGQEHERKLFALLAELENEEDYDDDFLKPEQIAFAKTRNILSQSYRGLYNFSLLPQFVLADGDGGIRVEWRNEARELRLLCSETGGMKIYWQENKDYDIEEIVTVPSLTARLEWLKEA